MANVTNIQESEYEAILRQAVAVINRTRTMVATTICSAIGSAHWEIGKLLHDRKLESKHGSGVVNRLSYDLKQRYPQMGVSPRNLWDMKKFYERFCESNPKLRQAVAVLPWGHTLKLMRKFGEDDNAISYYAQEPCQKVGIVTCYPVPFPLKCTQGRANLWITISSRHCLPRKRCLPMRCSRAVIISASLV